MAVSLDSWCCRSVCLVGLLLVRWRCCGGAPCRSIQGQRPSGGGYAVRCFHSRVSTPRPAAHTSARPTHARRAEVRPDMSPTKGRYGKDQGRAARSFACVWQIRCIKKKAREGEARVPAFRKSKRWQRVPTRAQRSRRSSCRRCLCRSTLPHRGERKVLLLSRRD